ncbi:MAG: glucose-1-phosphate adenylyltransferase [Calditrichaceae bacterium]|nr:glucose-1-phosphate adenylyltransferase [Calditrichaceae bacterium]MBN2710507.1 glucose-1-phosphate adenylyltransferase [Calditrichaceae bacterium]RQV97299.1 MAG: glucose-1-phosphate adenylyltransferase [Calditrichota bacterium]
MTKLTAVILGGGRGTRLDPLTRLRAKPAVPIGGKFRLIDIPMSNCLHSGVRKIFILTQFNTESLHRHIHNTYRFDHFSEGFVRILAAQQTSDTQDWYQGTADAVRKNLFYLRSADEHIIILSGDHLYRMDYKKFYNHHVEQDADITIAVKPIFEHEVKEFGIVKADENSKVTDFYEKPQEKEVLDKFSIKNELFEKFKMDAQGRTHIASMGIYIFKKKVLFEILEASDKEDFGKGILPDSIKTQKVFAYFFDGYWADIGTMRSFYEAHFELTMPVPRFNFYDEAYPFFTHPRFLPASKIYNCQINQSLVSEGSILLGSIIEHSVIGIRSYIDEGTFVQRSIIMGNSYYETIKNRNLNKSQGLPNLGIGNNCIIRNTIIDMDCKIGNNVQLINKDNQINADGENYAIRDGIIILPKGCVIQDNSII